MKAREVFLEILTDMARAVQAASLYPESHRRVREPLARMHRKIRSEAGRVGGSLSVGFLGDRIVVDRFPFHASIPGIGRLAGKMASRGIEKVVFGEDVSLAEVNRFVCFAAGAGDDGGRRPWDRISFACLGGIETAGLDGTDPGMTGRTPRLLAGAAETLKDVLHSIAVQGPAGNVEEGRDIVAAVMKSVREEEFLVDRMIRLQERDDYTVAHSFNVCVMVTAQASRMNLPETSVREIGLAAMLHDIGKELVPPEILNKPGKLDPGEMAKITLHPVLGACHLRKLSLATDLPVIVCYEHHIRHDRSGYPVPRFPDALHPASLMTQIADVYDALRTYRPYRPSLDRETALAILREGRGTEFDPVLLDDFIEMVS